MASLLILVAAAAGGCATAPPSVTAADVDAAELAMARAAPVVSPGSVGGAEAPDEAAAEWLREDGADEALPPLDPSLDLGSPPDREGSAAVSSPAGPTASPPRWNDGRRAGDASGSRRDPLLAWAPAAMEPAASTDENLFSWDYVKLVGTDIEQTFTAPTRWDGRDWLVAGGVAAAIGVGFAIDDNVRNAVQRNHNSGVDDVLDAIQPFGAEYSFGVLGAFYVVGAVFHDDRAKAVGMDGLAASLIASGIIAQPVKYGFGRARPNADQGPYHFRAFSGDQSFPSGHTTQAFAVATVIAEHYDALWVKVLSWGLASMVGFARIENDAHWTSDVLAGAALGYFVGELVVHVNEDHRHNVTVAPIVSPGAMGVTVGWSF